MAPNPRAVAPDPAPEGPSPAVRDPQSSGSAARTLSSATSQKTQASHGWDKGFDPRLARLFVATYGGSIDAVYTALGNLINNRKQFYPLRTTSVPGIGNCMVKAR
eukprot:s4986_g5.t1